MLLSEETKGRYVRFWDRSATDRACLYITYGDGTPAYRAPKDPLEKWGDMDYRRASTLYSIEHTRYAAEGFPSVFTNFGPGCLAACIGGSYLFAPDTVWFENKPFFVEDWAGRPSPRLDRESEMARMVETLTAWELSQGDKFITSITDIGGTYDVIAALRGTENLLYDMYDNPEEIKTLREEVALLWKEYFLAYADRLLAAQGGMTSWMPIWSEKTYYPLQCDYSAMLSPKMFAEFILPDLKEQTEYMDRSIYHLDGPSEIPHLELLLSLPRLNAIQWVPGDGNPEATDPCWFEMLRRIQAAGKGVILLGADPAALEKLFTHVSQRGLYISLGVRDAQEADEVVRMAEKLNF